MNGANLHLLSILIWAVLQLVLVVVVNPVA